MLTMLLGLLIVVRNRWHCTCSVKIRMLLIASWWRRPAVLYVSTMLCSIVHSIHYRSVASDSPVWARIMANFRLIRFHMKNLVSWRNILCIEIAVLLMIFFSLLSKYLFAV